MQMSDQFSISAYAVSVEAIICIEIGYSDDIAVVNVITPATKVVSVWAIPSRILANKGYKEGILESVSLYEAD